MSSSPLSLVRFFGRLRDPRRKHLRKHLLIDSLSLAICAVVGGADDWQQIVTFARQRREWFATFLALPGGIPSHDTFERVFDRIDPQAFLGSFQRWIEALASRLPLGHIAIDGKSLRGSANDPKGWKPLHLVSAWASQYHLSLGQVAVESKSNEIPAIPRLRELLDLHGALVTLDAMGCQKEIAKAIVDQGGDYVLVVKGNQEHLLEDIQTRIGEALDADQAVAIYDQWIANNKGHGRQERRTVLTIAHPEGMRNQEEWKSLNIIGMCIRERTIRGETSEEVSYFLGSRIMAASKYGEALRHHWGIENNLHWQLDVTFREDGSRVQRRHGAENLALLRRLALSLLKRHPGKESLACKRLAAGLNPQILVEILEANANSGKL